MKLTRLYIVTLVLLFGSGCTKEEPETDPEFLEDLRSAPDRLVVGKNHLELTVALWRDFTSASEKNGSPMMGETKISDSYIKEIDSTIRLEKQYVIMGNKLWTTNYEDVQNKPFYILSGNVRNGPKWGPDVEVDVVCEIWSKGIMYRIKSKSQTILGKY